LKGGGGLFSGAAREFFHCMGDAPMTRTRKAVLGREDEFRKGDVLWGCPVKYFRATLPSME
ncbi:MAG: hypothetical protein JRJ02_10080, partial [Deltaproteobacteria bacterium]|nr:hypothetical protein [Deltaproteobacteria bacterium]